MTDSVSTSSEPTTKGPLDLTGPWQLRRLRGEQPTPEELINLMRGEATADPDIFPESRLFRPGADPEDIVNETRQWSPEQSMAMWNAPLSDPDSWPTLRVCVALAEAATHPDPMTFPRLMGVIYHSEHVRAVINARAEKLRKMGTELPFNVNLLCRNASTSSAIRPRYGLTDQDATVLRHTYWMAGRLSLLELCAHVTPEESLAQIRQLNLDEHTIMISKVPDRGAAGAEIDSDPALGLLRVFAALQSVHHRPAASGPYLTAQPGLVTPHVNELLITRVDNSSGNWKLMAAGWIMAALRHPQWAAWELRLNPPGLYFHPLLCKFGLQAAGASELPGEWRRPLQTLNAALRATLETSLHLATEEDGGGPSSPRAHPLSHGEIEAAKKARDVACAALESMDSVLLAQENL